MLNGPHPCECVTQCCFVKFEIKCVKSLGDCKGTTNFVSRRRKVLHDPFSFRTQTCRTVRIDSETSIRQQVHSRTMYLTTYPLISLKEVLSSSTSVTSSNNFFNPFQETEHNRSSGPFWTSPRRGGCSLSRISLPLCSERGPRSSFYCSKV